MATVALVVHHRRKEAADVAVDLAGWLDGQGHEIRVAEADAARLGLTDQVGTAPDATDLCTGVDLAVSIGGDGTMLRTVDAVAATGVPVLGVNVGQLGFLAEVEPAAATSAVSRFLAGDYALEERMTLAVRVDSAHGERSPELWSALNEAVIEKVEPGRTVRVAVTVAGTFFTTYVCDGLIVATPTGSTAYSFSARGPIASPHLRAVLLTPVAPHMLFDWPLVLAPDEPVRLEVTDGRPATVSVDGRRVGRLEEGDALECGPGEHTAKLVTFGERRFHTILKTKFKLADR